MEEILNQEIENLGQFLKNIREEKKIPAAQVAQELKTSLSIIQAIENNEYEKLPARIYVKGYLRSYSKFLGLDEEMILTTYKTKYPDETKQELVIKQDKLPGININWQKIFNPKLWLPILIALVLIVASAILVIQIKKRRQIPAALPVIEPQEEIIAEPEPVVTAEPKEKAPLATPLATPITITAQATDAVWMRVHGDNKLIFEGILAKKEEKVWKTDKEFKLRIGNPGKLNLLINNHPYGRVSPFGGPVNAVVNKDGIKIEEKK